MNQHASPPGDSELARFGLTLALFCSVPAAWRLLGSSSWFALAGLAAAAALAGLAGLRPGGLARLHAFMTRVGAVAGRVNTTLLLTLAFGLLIVPIGLLMRLTGRDPLDRRLRDRESYWHRREPPADPRGSMEHIF